MLVFLGFVSVGVFAGCDDDDDDNDTADDDDNDDDNNDDNNDDNDNDNDNDDTADDDDDDDDDDNDTTPDDWVAPWPQSNILPRDYDESPAAGDLRAKAEAFDLWHLENHQPYYGGSADVRFEDETHQVVIAYGGWGDSCIWSGTYLASQAMRYWVTNDEQARENVLRMVGTLDGFLHVTGRPGFIARYWAPQESLMYQGDDWCDDPNQDRCHHWEDGEFAGDFWWGETSRDQYTGWFFGMALAYDLVDDATMRETIRDDVAEVLDELIANHWWILDEAGEPTDAAPNIMLPFRLSWLTTGYHVTGEERFKVELQKYLLNEKRTALRLSSIAFLNRYAQYYGNNLAHTNWFHILRLGAVYYSADDYAFMRDLFEQQVHTFTRLSHNPWFNGVFMTQGAYEPQRDDPYFDQLVLDLADFPDAPNVAYYLPERTGFEMDQLSVFLNDLQEQFPWLEELVGEINPQAKDAFPVPEQCSSGFMFQKNPFRFEECGVDDPAVVEPGVDFLIAYWLSSYGKFLTKEM
jgi:hypothetical protein